MTEITWIGPDRELPGLGLVRSGQRIELADWAAESYVYQGLAKKVAHQKSKRRSSTHADSGNNEETQP
jgi:hypothetical protein